MRIAFVTTEYLSEGSSSGGLASYIGRMSSALVDAGHRPEIFVASNRHESIDRDGIIVHHVDAMAWRERTAFLSRVPRYGRTGHAITDLLGRAASLAAALRERERAEPFDFVQSADYQAAGLFVSRRSDRLHLVRCSAAADLWDLARWQCHLERLSIRRADRAYAPSRFVANHLSSTFGLRVDVVRPPLFQETLPAREAVDGLPSRFLMHFGQLRRRKGSEFLAATLPLVWQQDPSVRMVWAGHDFQMNLDQWRGRWGAFADHVVHVGAVDKPKLYGMLVASAGSVLPSQVDNLPNTVIESLLCDRPVIGTFDSSIDEVVSDGGNGLLVRFEDREALAAAILKVWRGSFGIATRLMQRSPLVEEMRPGVAVDRLLRFAGRRESTSVAAVRASA